VAEEMPAKPAVEQSITRAAKAFIANPSASSLYIEAVSSTVEMVVSVIEAKVEREAASPPAEDGSAAPKA
jgi:hypothetical protein